MSKNEIIAAFDVLLDEFEGVVEQLNEEGAQALRLGHYEKATRLIEQATQLTQFRNRLTQFRREWQTQFADGTDAGPRGRMRPPWRIIIHQAVQALLTRSGRETFTPAQVYREVGKTYPNFNRGTNNAQIMACCVNSDTRRHYPGDKPDYYYHVARGVYRLYNPDTDGLWDQQGNPIQTPA